MSDEQVEEFSKLMERTARSIGMTPIQYGAMCLDAAIACAVVTKLPKENLLSMIEQTWVHYTTEGLKLNV